MKFDHIIIITQDFPPQVGGIQTWCVQLAKHFADKEFKVTVLTHSFENFKEEPFSYKNVEVVRLDHREWKRKKNFRIYKALKNIITPKSIILASYWKMAFPVLVYNLFNKVPFFTTTHGLDIYENRRINSAMQRSTYKNSNCVIAVSNYTKSLLESKNIQADIKVINNGFDPKEYFKTEVPDEIFSKYKFDKSKLNLLNVARLIKRKGFDTTIKAVSEIDDAIFHIGGKGKFEKDLKKLVEENNLNDKVIFHGLIPESDMNYLYNAADLFIMPSRKEGVEVEGFGITYMEAAAAGTPSIGSFNSGAEDAIEDGKSGILVDGNDISSIKKGIEFFKENPDELKNMGDYAYERALNNFTWDKISDEFIRTFKKFTK